MGTKDGKSRGPSFLCQATANPNIYRREILPKGADSLVMLGAIQSINICQDAIQQFSNGQWKLSGNPCQ